MADDSQETKFAVIHELTAQFSTKADMMENFIVSFAAKDKLVRALKSGLSAGKAEITALAEEASTTGAVIEIREAQASSLADGKEENAEFLDNTVNTLAGNGKVLYVGDDNSATAAILRLPYNMVINPAGMMYIADSGHNLIRKVGTDGLITTVAGNGLAGFAGGNSPASEAVLNSPRGVATGKDGSLFIADTLNHRIRKIDAAGIITTLAGSGQAGWSGDGGLATAARLNTPIGIATGLDGSIYVADTQNHCIRKVDAQGTITTIAGIGEAGYSGDGGLATAARLNTPIGIATGLNGSIYVADTQNHRIRKVDAQGTITTIAGTGEAGYSGDGGLAGLAGLNSPTCLATGNDGTIYIGDTDNQRIRKINGQGIITTIAGNGEAGFTRNGILAGEVRLAYPSGIAISSDGSIYIADKANNRIRRIDADGIIKTVAGSGTIYFVGDQGPAIEAILIRPTGLAAGPDGSFYIADAFNQRIRKLGSDGIITTLAGTGEYGFNGDGGLAQGAMLAQPFAAAVGTDGSIYIADQGNNRIRRIDPAGNITTVAGTGEAGYSGDGDLAPLAKLNNPLGLAVGADGSIYVADCYNLRIRKIDPAGIITTIAGTGEAGNSGDGGPAVLAQLNCPVAATIDPDGSLYITDCNNHRIRKINTDGIITTVAGTGEAGYSGDGGPAINARFYYPADTAVGGDGNLYIADQYNHRIRMIDARGIITTIAGNGEAAFSGDGEAGTVAKLNYPLGVAAGADGSIYIADRNNNRIRKVDSAGMINTVAGTGEIRLVNDGILATRTVLAMPTNGCLGPDGILYIADQGSNRIRMVNAGNIITTIAGSGEDYFKGDGGLAVGAAFRSPADVAIDAEGSLYIADRDNHRVRKIKADGLITTIAGTGEAGYSGDNGPGRLAKLNSPAGITVDVNGSIYIADNANHRVRKLEADGVITTLAGTGEAGDSGDGGPAIYAQLNNPVNMAVGADGIYIVDKGNNRIRMVSPDGIIITVAGNGEAGYNGDEILAINAALWSPSAVVVGKDSSLYIADTLNNRIRKVSPRGVITTFAGTGEFGFNNNDISPAKEAKFKHPSGLTIGPDGCLYVFDMYNNRIRRIAPPLPRLQLPRFPFCAPSPVSYCRAQ